MQKPSKELKRTKKEQTFIDTVMAYYRTYGRHTLPWRTLHADRRGYVDAYRILVSEVMLQQTQVPRVQLKYTEFVHTFPTVCDLATAPLSAVLRVWQGLGYNRRAKMLHQCAQTIVNEHGGVFPCTYTELCDLPGIGPYTAGAVMAFAYNEPIPLIETNVRTVYLHHFFADREEVSDRDILALVARTLDHDDPRSWYAAIMDYGTYLKKEYGNLNQRSKHYTRQTAFKGSDRQIRGAILRAAAAKPFSLRVLPAELRDHDTEKLLTLLDALCAEGLLEKRRTRYQLP